MKKILLFILVLSLSISLLACTNAGNEAKPEKDGQNIEEQQQNNEADEKAVTGMVEAFGKKLQTVSLLAPKDVLEKSMKENYGEFVSQALLNQWINDPENAPGRLTSSPWPDRIEVRDAKRVSEGIYEVNGEIIEITSTEQANDGIAAKRPITVTVKKADSKWLIEAVTLGDYDTAD